MTAELKPCPFCGVEASEVEDQGHSTAYSVGCFNGDCTIEPNTWADTKAEAIAAWNTRADLSQAAISAKNAQILDLIEALRRRSDGEICGCGVDNPTDVCLSHYDVIEAVVRNRIQVAIAAAMMGAVKPLEWSNALGYSYTACAGQYFYEWFSESKPTDKQLIVSGCKYDNHRTLEKDTVVLGYYPTLDAAKAAAQADYQARILSALSIPTDAAATLGAALLGAYKEGWSDGAANCHHDRNETPDDGWLISDTYKSIPADAAAALEAVKAVKAQVRDDTVRSAAIAAGNAIVAIAADADPDISPLRKQMLRVKMEKAVKAAFTRDA